MTAALLCCCAPDSRIWADGFRVSPGRVARGREFGVRPTPVCTKFQDFERADLQTPRSSTLGAEIWCLPLGAHPTRVTKGAPHHFSRPGLFPEFVGRIASFVTRCPICAPNSRIWAVGFRVSPGRVAHGREFGVYPVPMRTRFQGFSAANLQTPRSPTLAEGIWCTRPTHQANILVALRRVWWLNSQGILNL